jgi:hypothetical protein
MNPNLSSDQTRSLNRLMAIKGEPSPPGSGTFMVGLMLILIGIGAWDWRAAVIIAGSLLVITAFCTPEPPKRHASRGPGGDR